MRPESMVREDPTRCTNPPPSRGQLITKVQSCHVLPPTLLEGCIEGSFGGLVAAAFTWIYAHCRNPFGKIGVALALNSEYGSMQSNWAGAASRQRLLRC